MDKQQEIERMATTMVINQYFDTIHEARRCAKTLIEVDIGDKKQAVKEFVLRLKSYTRLSTDGVNYIESVDIRAIDKLFTELYGDCE